MPHTIQIQANQYGKEYLTFVRTITHWYQANEVCKVCPPEGKVLEIGVGCGHTTWLLRHYGLEVTTVDHDPELHPDVVADLLALPFETGSFDCVLAAEVLEHLPFEEFEPAVGEIARVSRGNIVLTLPAPLVGLSCLVNTPLLPTLGFSLGLPFFCNHRFDGQHYWELGKRGYSKRRIRSSLRRQGLAIIREFRPQPCLYCYFFVTCREQKSIAKTNN